MRTISNLIDPDEIAITWEKCGREVTEKFIVSSIPGFYALKIYSHTCDLLHAGKVEDMPNEIVLELLKYAACGEKVLESEEIIDSCCGNAEVILAVALEVWKRNFSFLRTRKFPKMHGSSSDASGLIRYTGIDPLIGYIVHRGHASLWDCKHRYSYEELYDIWEADAVPEDNTSTIQRRAVEQAKMKRGQ